MTTTRRHSRGQTIILGAVSMLAMALMMMASYSVGNAIHQKIALQSQADAESYSVAVAEARVLNVIAYHNRAIVATLVAQMSLHAWMAVATADVDQLWDGDALMLEINAFEISEGCRMIAPWVPHPMAWLHCPHLVEAEWDGLMFFLRALKWDDKLDGLESSFNDGVDAIASANRTIWTRENTILVPAAAQVIGMGDVTDALKLNAPSASISTPVMALNAMEFACVFEGAQIDLCKSVPGFINPYRALGSNDNRSKVIQSDSNAARPLITNGSVAGIAGTIVMTRNYTGDFDSNSKEPNDVLTSGTWDMTVPPMVKGHIGESEPNFLNQYFATSPIFKFSSDDKAKNAAAGAGLGMAWIKNWGWMKPSHGHAPWNPLPFGGGVYSDQSGGGHGLMYWFWGGQSHAKYKGFTPSDPCQQNTSCFLNYRGQTDVTKDYGQPSVYAGFTQSLRMYDAKAGDKDDRKMSDKAVPPWEINKNGKIDVKFVKKTATVNYVPRGDGHAVSKSLVYFHQLGDWQVPPNLFDPFWRAKLHFFKSRTEFGEVAGLTGDGMTGVIGPYDGAY